MGLFGTLIGGGLGALFGGPLGALLGASIGSTFGDRTSSNGQDFKRNAQETKQIAFYTCFFTVLAKIAKADNVVTTEEINAVNNIIVQKLKLQGTTADVTRKIFNNAIKDSTPVCAYIRQFGEIVEYNKEVCQLLINSMREVSIADGIVSKNEEEIINEAIRILILGEETEAEAEYREHVKSQRARNQQSYHQRSSYNSYSNNDSEQRRSSYSDSNSKQESHSHSQKAYGKLGEAYEILECSPDMDDSTIKKSYRKKVAKFHPDKLQSKGLPEEFLEFAHNEMVKINEAYDTVMTSRK